MGKCYHEVEHAIPMIYRLTECRATLSPPRASRAELITRMALSQPEAAETVQKHCKNVGKADRSVNRLHYGLLFRRPQRPWRAQNAAPW